MTKFEDRLLGQLMAEHGHRLRAPERPAPARHRVRRPVWLASGAVGTAAATTAAVVALSSAPAMAYSVSQHDGTVSVSVYKASGVAGANGALHSLGARIAVVPVHPGCRPMGSLPRPHPAPHISTEVASGVRDGQRYVTVKIKGSIPRGDTLILAFFGSGRPGTTSGGAGGIITGPVPRCVSLSPVPHGSGPASGSASSVAQAG
jgi:hypothetical protein